MMMFGFGLFGLFPLFLFVLVAAGAGSLYRALRRSHHHRSRGASLPQQGAPLPQGARLPWSEDFASPSRQGRSPSPAQPADPELSKPVRHPSEADIFRLAARHGGRLSLSDVVIETDLDMKEAEQFMDQLADGMHVRIEVDPRGVIFYEFPELSADTDHRATESGS